MTGFYFNRETILSEFPNGFLKGSFRNFALFIKSIFTIPAQKRFIKNILTLWWQKGIRGKKLNIVKKFENKPFSLTSWLSYVFQSANFMIKNRLSSCVLRLVFIIIITCKENPMELIFEWTWKFSRTTIIRLKIIFSLSLSKKRNRYV